MRAPNDKKFRELILFIAEKSEGDRPFGATKLNKLLFRSDFAAYLMFGNAITWHRYQALGNGPATRALLPILEKMEKTREIAFAERNFYGRPQRRVIALRAPDLSLFSAAEIDLVTTIIEECWGKTATRMSQLSHEFIGWKLAENGEDIPYEVALIDERAPTPKEIEKGIQFQKLAQKALEGYETSEAKSHARG